MDLISHRIIGWSMRSRKMKGLVFDALMIAVWLRKPEREVLVHPDEGSQKTSHD